jgi:hypothetical protein
MKCTYPWYRPGRSWKPTVVGASLPWRSRVWRQMLVAVFLVSVAHAQSPKQLWVLQEPDEIVEYDMTSFAARRTLKVPHRLLHHPEYLSINSKGQMVFFPPKGMHWASGEMASAGDIVWFWDGHETKEWKLELENSGVSAGKPTVVETERQWFLSATGESLFRFESRFEKVLDETGLERSMRSASRLLRTDLAGSNLEAITSLSSPEWCRCSTGVCSETCPEWYFWVPDGIVDDFFLVTRFTPGQLGPTTHESLLYQRTERGWQVKKLPQPIQTPLTASKEGEILIMAVPDAGCCGWENESNDQMLLLHNGKVTVLWDEFDHYGNPNYDVSFYTADACIAPGNGLLAYTVVSTARPGAEIRLSSEGKENAEALARVRKTIGELPAVEIVNLGFGPLRPTVIRHATFVDWVSDREILVVQDGRLALYDLRGTKLRETTIRVRSGADAFLR